MNLESITVDAAEARAKLAEYQGLIRDERTAEDEAIAVAYRAAARGLPVISLPRTIGAGGFFQDNGMPRLAVIRADATECFVRWMYGDLVFSDRDDWRVNRGALVGAHSVRIPVAGDDVPAANRRAYWRSASTIVPIVPPRYRPSQRRLRHCHILWEVEEWTRVPPRDPALLRHIRGDLWTVLAVWDLTDLERLVLSQR
jgi:hypothetical protein